MLYLPISLSLSVALSVCLSDCVSAIVSSGEQLKKTPGNFHAQHIGAYPTHLTALQPSCADDFVLRH